MKRKLEWDIREFLKKELHLQKTPREFTKKWNKLVERLVELVLEQRDLGKYIFKDMKNITDDIKIRLIKSITASFICTYLDELVPPKDRADILKTAKEILDIKEPRREYPYNSSIYA